MGFLLYFIKSKDEVKRMDDFRSRTNNLKTYKKDAIKYAKQLCYNQEVIDRLKKAMSTSEVCRIMSMARKGEL